MQPTDDGALLRQYAESHCDEAFAALVTRHINLVHSVARRHVGDPHQAEEITQAVFIILAKKAGQLRHGKALSSWLFQATRRTAGNFVRSEIRRHRREQEAHMQSSLNEPGNDDWPRIAPLLDTAVAGLSEKDRQAIVLRFYDGRNLREVGAALGASEDAAAKRVGRALEKLRTFFTRRGVTISASGLIVVLSANAVQAAPIGLSAAIAASPSVANATVITMNWLNLKLVAAVTALAVVAGAGVFLVQQPKIAFGAIVRAATPAAALPIKLANDAFAGRSDDQFSVGVDALTKRTNGSAPAGYIKSLGDPAGPSSPDYLRLRGARFAQVNVTKDSPLFGKRVRFTGWLKTRDVDNWAGLQLMIQNPAGKIIAMDEMMDRPVRGTTEWTQYEMVADVPAEKCVIAFGTMSCGTGELWTDDFQIDVVSTNVPITNDRLWHKWSPNAADYSVGPDPENQRDGHPTLCLAFTPRGAAPRGSWMWWGQCIREPEKYAGHTVRMTVWLKSEGAGGNAGINLRPKGPNFQLIAEDDRSLRRHLRGTVDWTERSIICAVPKETQCLDTGFYFNGKGKLWIDMESLKYEIIDDASVPVIIR